MPDCCFESSGPVCIERLMHLGDSDFVWENNHADVAEDRPDVDQPSQTAKGAGEASSGSQLYSGRPPTMARPEPAATPNRWRSSAPP